MDNPLVRIDGILWNIKMGPRGRSVIPICPIHSMRMNASEFSIYLKCEECGKSIKMPRAFGDERRYVLDRVDAKIYKTMKVINLDDEAIPLAEGKYSKDNKYFVTAIITESKIGKRLVIYAGEKGKQNKTQIFVEPEIKRLSFDQNNLHPTDVFTKIEATFSDNTIETFEKKE